MRVIYIDMQAPRPRLMIICRTELIDSDTADGSLFLFRHTERPYGDFFTIGEMEVKKENVTRIAQKSVSSWIEKEE